MSAAGELRALWRDRAARRGGDHAGGPVHLEFFASVDAIAAAKAEILEGLRAGGRGRAERRRRAACAGSARPSADASSGSAATGATTSPRRAGAGTGFGMRFDLRVGGPRGGRGAPPGRARTSSRTSWPRRRRRTRWASRPRRWRRRRRGLAPARHRGEVRAARARASSSSTTATTRAPTRCEAAVVALTCSPGGAGSRCSGTCWSSGPPGRRCTGRRARPLAGGWTWWWGWGRWPGSCLEGAQRSGAARGRAPLLRRLRRRPPPPSARSWSRATPCS